MNKRGLITAIIILIIVGGIVFGAVYLSNERIKKSQGNLENKSLADNSGINNVTCKHDSDCVPASCCHPSKCTSLDKAPNCKGTFCTMECAPNSLDCSQGSCACINNKCEAVFR